MGTKISQLPADTSPTLTDSVPTLDAETTSTKKTLLSSIRDLFFNNVPSSSPIVTGWQTNNPSGNALPTPNSITDNGNGNYSLVFNSVDLTSYLAQGMKLRGTRSTTAAVQCTSLNGTSQYYTNTSPADHAWTDDFTCMGWIKITQYGANSMIVNRISGNSGYQFYINTNGQMVIAGLLSAGNNKTGTSYASVPLNKWIHVAATLDMSASTATGYFDGQSISMQNGSQGTANNFTQAGTLAVGADSGGAQYFFPGKLSYIAVFKAVLTAATIASYRSQGLTGSETSLVSAWSFNNSINDLSANANNLTANGSAVATNSDSPFAGGATASTAYTPGTTEFGEIFNISFSTNTTVVVQAAPGYAFPASGGLSALAYSTAATPLGWPLPGGIKVVGEVLQIVGTSGVTTETDLLGLSITVYVPAGRKVKVFSFINNANSTSANTGPILLIYEDGTQVAYAPMFITTNAVANAMQLPSPVRNVSTGNHTYKLRGSSNNSTTFSGTSTSPNYIRVELD